MDTTKLVVIRTFPNEIEAEIAKEKLTTHHIQAFIRKDDEGGMFPNLQLTQGVQLGVLESDQKKAEKVLAS